MATLTWFLTNNSVGPGSDLSLTSPGAEAFRAPVTGWIVSTTGTNSSEWFNDTERAAATFTANTVPDGSLDTSNGDFWVSPTPLRGDFANANWAVALMVRANTGGGTHDGRMVCRLFRGPTQDGVGATQITAAQQVGSTVTDLTTAASQTSTATFNPGAFSVSNEYIFVQLAWQRTGAGGAATNDANARIGTGASNVLTADFTDTSILFEAKSYRQPAISTQAGQTGFVQSKLLTTLAALSLTLFSHSSDTRPFTRDALQRQQPPNLLCSTLAPSSALPVSLGVFANPPAALITQRHQPPNLLGTTLAPVTAVIPASLGTSANPSADRRQPPQQPPNTLAKAVEASSVIPVAFETSVPQSGPRAQQPYLALRQFAPDETIIPIAAGVSDAPLAERRQAPILPPNLLARAAIDVPVVAPISAGAFGYSYPPRRGKQPDTPPNLVLIAGEVAPELRKALSTTGYGWPKAQQPFRFPNLLARVVAEVPTTIPVAVGTWANVPPTRAQQPRMPERQFAPAETVIPIAAGVSDAPGARRIQPPFVFPNVLARAAIEVPAVIPVSAGVFGNPRAKPITRTDHSPNLITIFGFPLAEHREALITTGYSWPKPQQPFRFPNLLAKAPLPPPFKVTLPAPPLPAPRRVQTPHYPPNLPLGAFISLPPVVVPVEPPSGGGGPGGWAHHWSDYDACGLHSRKRKRIDEVIAAEVRVIAQIKRAEDTEPPLEKIERLADRLKTLQAMLLELALEAPNCYEYIARKRRQADEDEAMFIILSLLDDY